MIRLAFGIMSARELPDVVGQLVDALGSADTVVIHHDYAVQPEFNLNRPKVAFVPEPAQTGWGTSGFCHGVFRLIRHALAVSDFDYFQLLSGSCLPTQPIDSFRAHLAKEGRSVHADAIDLVSDDAAMFSHGHRVYCRGHTLGAKVMRRARGWSLSGPTRVLQRASLGIEVVDSEHGRDSLIQQLGRGVYRAAQKGMLDSHPFTEAFRPFVGSTWFCLRRDVCEWLVAQEDAHPAMGFLLSLTLCDEIVFPTLLFNQNDFTFGPSNHLVNRFDGSHPTLFQVHELNRLIRSDRFFARKFRMDVHDPVREQLVAHLHRADTREPDLVAG